MGKAVLAPRDVVGLLESTYRFDQDDDAWLTQLITAVAPQIEPGGGGAAYFLDVSGEERFRAWGWRGVGDCATQETAEGFANWNATVPIEFKRRIHLFGPCGVGSQLPGDPAFDPESVALSNDTHQVPDMFGINALDSTGRGCALVGYLASRPTERMAPEVEALWARVSAHVAAAARVRRRLTGAPLGEDAMDEALFTPSGRAEHLSGRAESTTGRAVLKSAVMQLEMARRRGRKLDGFELTDAWRSLVAGRWTLLDRFDRDGKRYLVARKNAPSLEPDQTSSLTSREQQIAGAAAMGHSNKFIAYELSVSPSTVSTILTRVARKLGVSSRVELIQRLNRSE